MKSLHKIRTFIFRFVLFNLVWFTIFAVANWTVDLGDWNHFFRTIWVLGVVVGAGTIHEDL